MSTARRPRRTPAERQAAHETDHGPVDGQALTLVSPVDCRLDGCTRPPLQGGICLDHFQEGRHV